MSDAAAAPAVQSDSDRAVSARLDTAAAGNILRLLRTLFAYGRNLVQALRQEDDPETLPWYACLTNIFGTTDSALITVLIIRGLLRAAALQARLSKSVAALLPFPLREDRIAKRNDRGGGPGPRKLRAAGWAIPPGWPAEDTSLDRQPSPEEEMFAEIVAEDRDRPIGAILLDICLDLGIVPAQMDPSTWDELRLAISLHGGDPATLLSRCADSDAAPVGRKSEAHSATPTPGPSDSPPSPVANHPTLAYPPWPAPDLQSPAPACTGPP